MLFRKKDISYETGEDGFLRLVGVGLIVSFRITWLS